MKNILKLGLILLTTTSGASAQSSDSAALDLPQGCRWLATVETATPETITVMLSTWLSRCTPSAPTFCGEPGYRYTLSAGGERTYAVGDQVEVWASGPEQASLDLPTCTADY